MHSQLNHIKSQQRMSELSRAAAYRRVADQPRSQHKLARPRPIRRVSALIGRISAARA
jgi:hypothetical protein